MTGTADGFAPTRSVGGTRAYMAGAVAGAVIVLMLSVTTGWSITKITDGPTDPAQVAAEAAVGDCLTWTKSTAQDLTEVDCAQPHLFQVTGSATVSGQAAFPTQDSWQQLTKSDCTASATAFVGTLDPYGKYVVGALKPTEQQWNSGSRTVRCGLQGSNQAGGLMTTIGTAKGQDQSDVYPTGICLALVNNAAGGPVDCGTAHAYEIVGTVDLSSQFPSGYPAVADQQTALAKLCQPVVDAYSHGLALSTYGLTLTWDTIRPESWAAGSHKVNCKVGALAQDGSGLSPVSNSIAGVGSAGSGSGSGAGSGSGSGSTQTTLPGGG